MTAKNRPISPHLQVYRPQITSVTSILHRLSGIALAVGAVLLAWWLIAAASGDPAFDAVSSFIDSIIGRIILLGFTVALFFHFCNGIRHLMWGAGFGYALTTANRTGWAVIIATVILTIAAWVAGYAVKG